MAVSHIKSNIVADWTGTVTVGNSAGGTATVAATDLVRPVDWNSVHNQFYTLSGNTNNASTASGTNVHLQGVGAVTLIGSTATIGISVAGPITYSRYAPYDEGVDALHAVSNGSFWINPVQFPNVQYDRVGIRFAHSNATNSTGSATYAFLFGLYTRNASTLSLYASTSRTAAITFSGTGGNQTIQAGPRIFTIAWTTTITAGDYWAGIGVSYTTAGANNTIMSMIHNSQINSTFSGIFGVGTNATDQRRLGEGRYTAATAAVPGSIGFTQIQGNSSAFQRPVKFLFLSQSA